MSLKSLYEERKRQNLNINQLVQENQMLLENISMLKKDLQQKSETIVRQNEEIVSRNETIVRQNEEIVSKNEEIVRLNERIVTLNESDLELKKARDLKRSAEELFQKTEAIRHDLADKSIFTYEVYQNDVESDDLEYTAKNHQPYFEFEIFGKNCLIGLDKILECLVIAEKIEEIPKLGDGFWTGISEKFHINYYDYRVKLSQE